MTGKRQGARAAPGVDPAADTRAERRFDWPPFRRLVVVQFAHTCGDALVAVALANTLFFAVPLGEARSKVGLYLALTMAPFAVLSPVVGPLLDRRRGAYRTAILVAAAGRALLAVVLSSRTDRLQLYPLAFGLLVFSRVHGVSRSSLVPDAMPPHRTLMWSNARLSIVSVFGGLAGGGSGLALSEWIGPHAALWAAAVAFAFGALVSIHLPQGEGPVRAARSGARSVLLSPRLLAGGISMAGSRAAVGFLTFLLAFLLRRADETASGFAVVVAAAGAGSFVGAVVAPALRAVMRESVLLLATLVGMSAAALWASTGFDVTRAAIVAAAVGIGSGVGRLAFDSLLQHDAPQAVRGRTFTRYETIFQLCWVAGAAVATVIPFHAAGGMRALAAVCLLTAVLTVRRLLRGETAHPATP
ncbi:MAG: MFS transporter [Actinomycetota bacterium]|nr:MFS transporter [Actinomycetota bacterium]